jgi:hypothetical protein
MQKRTSIHWCAKCFQFCEELGRGQSCFLPPWGILVARLVAGGTPSFILRFRNEMVAFGGVLEAAPKVLLTTTTWTSRGKKTD